MATMRPQVAPRRHPLPPAPAPAPAPLPSLAVVAQQQLPCKRSHAGVARGRKESVAESGCCPSEPVLIDLDSGSDGEEDDDDGCGSCVDGGGEGSRGQDGEEEGSGSVVVWGRQENSSNSRCFLWAKKGSTTAERGHSGDQRDDEEEDPKVAAATAARRKEEDRKFWEACLASGYP